MMNYNYGLTNSHGDAEEKKLSRKTTVSVEEIGL
jgi:hypothetical protein